MQTCVSPARLRTSREFVSSSRPGPPVSRKTAVAPLPQHCRTRLRPVSSTTNAPSTLALASGVGATDAAVSADAATVGCVVGEDPVVAAGGALDPRSAHAAAMNTPVITTTFNRCIPRRYTVPVALAATAMKIACDRRNETAGSCNEPDGCATDTTFGNLRSPASNVVHRLSWDDPGLARTVALDTSLIVEANEAALELLGRDLVGRHWHELAVPSSLDQRLQMRDFYVANGGAASTFRLIGSSGELIDYDYRLSWHGDRFVTVMSPFVL